MSKGIIDFLTAWDTLDEMRGVEKNPALTYQSFYDLVHKLGRTYTYTPELPEGIERGPMGDCFQNALHAAVDHNLTYVEGFATGIIPTHHAWVTEDGKHAIDVTWDHPSEYYGIAFNTRWLVNHVTGTGYYGVFGEMVEPDWIKHGMPPGAIKRFSKKAAGAIKRERSPLDYHGFRPERFAIYDPSVGEDPSRNSYFAPQGLVAFLDWSSEGNGAYIHYMSTREDQRGQGLARKLVMHLYNSVEGDIDWGNIMSDEAETLWRSFRESHPERGNRGKIR